MSAQADAYLPAEELRKKRLKGLIITVILVSVGIHVLAGIIAGVVIVARYLTEPPAEFKVTKDIRIPAQEREHKMNMAAFDGMAPKPSFTDKMQSLRPTAFSLPDLPKVPMDQMLPLDPAQIMTDQVTSLMGSGGLGSGTGYGSGGGGGTGGLGTGFSFMGIQSKGKRILLIFDVSSSVVNKANGSSMPLTRIKDETKTLLGQLPISARFGLIQFTQNYKAFKTELLPASDANREAATQWIDAEWVEAGTMGGGNVVSNPKGLVGVLELAAKMQPDVIFLISDASFQWRVGGSLSNIPWDDVKNIVKGPLQGAEGCKINFVGFEVKPADRQEIGGIARSSGGKMREIK